MNNIYQQIENSAHFRELVERRQRFAFSLSIIMLIIYVAYSAYRFCAALARYAAARRHQRDARHPDWDWRDCDFVCADRRLRLAGKR